GGKTFHDVGLVSADDDGHTDLCLGWNAFTVDGTAVPAEAIQVRYVVGNAGTADLLNCSIGEGNPGFPGTVSVGSLAGACVADVANCVVTDTNFTEAGCPASGTPSGASSAVAVTPSTIASLAAGAPASVTGTIAGLTQNSCNTVSVTCEIVGSVDPANPSARKKVTATAQHTCETCSV